MGALSAIAVRWQSVHHPWSLRLHRDNQFWTYPVSKNTHRHGNFKSAYYHSIIQLILMIVFGQLSNPLSLLLSFVKWC